MTRTVGVEIVGAIGRRPGRRIFTASGVSTDSRTLQPGEVFFALPGARVDGHDFALAVLQKGAAAVVVMRDVAVPPEYQEKVVRVEDTVRALGESARAWRREWGGKVIAVTGSNGKTTTREMIHHLLSEVMPCKRSPKSFNTEVGVPLTLFTVDRSDRAAIVEMGMNAFGEIAQLVRIAEPDAGVITSIAEAHIEALGSLEGVARAKAELLEGLPPKGMAFLNADCEWFDFLRARHAGPVTAFGAGPRATFRAEDIRPDGRGYRAVVRGAPVRLTVPGRHNVFNALAALAVAEWMGLDLRRAVARLESFVLPEMRYQLESLGGVTVAFDGYNANPGSMRAALETFAEMPAGRRAAVLGDMLELGEQSASLHADLGARAAAARLDALWCVGRFAECTAEAARRRGVPFVRASEGIDGMAEDLCAHLRPGDALLVKGSRGMKLERLVETLRASRIAERTS